MRNHMVEQPRKVVLVCPCCASPVDAAASEQVETFFCVVCEQVWEMIVDPQRIAEYALT